MMGRADALKKHLNSHTAALKKNISQLLKPQNSGPDPPPPTLPHTTVHQLTEHCFTECLFIQLILLLSKWITGFHIDMWGMGKE